MNSQASIETYLYCSRCSVPMDEASLLFEKRKSKVCTECNASPMRRSNKNRPTNNSILVIKQSSISSLTRSKNNEMGCNADISSLGDRDSPKHTLGS